MLLATPAGWRMTTRSSDRTDRIFLTIKWLTTAATTPTIEAIREAVLKSRFSFRFFNPLKTSVRVKTKKTTKTR